MKYSIKYNFGATIMKIKLYAETIKVIKPNTPVIIIVKIVDTFSEAYPFIITSSQSFS